MSSLCRYAAGKEELGKWTVMLILVQASMGLFGFPYISEGIFTRWCLKLCFQCTRISFFFFSSVFHKSWSTVSMLKNILLGWKPLCSFHLFFSIRYFILRRAYLLSQHFYLLVRSFLKCLISIEVFVTINLRDWISFMCGVIRNCRSPAWINLAGDRFHCFLSPPAPSKCSKSRLTDLLGTSPA